jgi:hypothetical protein
MRTRTSHCGAPEPARFLAGGVTPPASDGARGGGGTGDNDRGPADRHRGAPEEEASDGPGVSPPAGTDAGSVAGGTDPALRVAGGVTPPPSDDARGDGGTCDNDRGPAGRRRGAPEEEASDGAGVSPPGTERWSGRRCRSISPPSTGAGTVAGAGDDDRAPEEEAASTTGAAGGNTLAGSTTGAAGGSLASGSGRPRRARSAFLRSHGFASGRTLSSKTTSGLQSSSKSTGYITFGSSVERVTPSTSARKLSSATFSQLSDKIPGNGGEVAADVALSCSCGATMQYLFTNEAKVTSYKQKRMQRNFLNPLNIFYRNIQENKDYCFRRR